MTELYLYAGIYNYSVQPLLAQMEQNKLSEILIRINSFGGSVMTGWGLIGKLKDRKISSIAQVDGVAASMAAVLLPFFSKVIAYNVSRIMLHRADMDVESPEEQEILDKINKDLRAALEVKIDQAKLKEIKRITLDQIFDPTSRIDVWLSGDEAKSIGLVDEVVNITEKEMEAMSEKIFSIAASGIPQEENKNSNPKIMDLLKLKAEHPALYAEIFALGKEQGVKEEKERVEAALVFNEIDPVGVKAAIESGKPLSPKQMAEFCLKQNSPEALAKLQAASAGKVNTGAVDTDNKTEKEKQVEAIENDLDKKLGLKK